MNVEMVNKIIEYISVFLSLLIILPFHEFAHAFAAVKSGDITPKISGRYTLNPLAHFDIYGLLGFVLVGFGWAKPMPVNPYNFREYKRGCFWVSVAGVLTNYLLAFIAFPLFTLSLLYVPEFVYFTTVLQQTLYYLFHLNLVFVVFNMIPVYPLDGFRVVDVFAKKRGKLYQFLRNYGIYVLYALLGWSFLCDILGLWQLDIFSNLISFLTGIISYPISLFWGLIF